MNEIIAAHVVCIVSVSCRALVKCIIWWTCRRVKVKISFEIIEKLGQVRSSFDPHPNPVPKSFYFHRSSER